MPMTRRTAVSRRRFIGTGAGALLAAPLIVPSRVLGADAPSNRIRVGHIGCGRIFQVHDLPGVLKSGLADVLAVCDVDGNRAGEARVLVEKTYRDAKSPAPR